MTSGGGEIMEIGRSGRKMEKHLEQRDVLFKVKNDRKVSIENPRFNWEKVDSDDIGR